MQKTLILGTHIPEEMLEEYAFARLREPQAGRVEEHLLICEVCQEALADLDDYIRAMKAATAEPAIPLRRRGSLPYVAAAAIAAGIAIALLWPARPAPAESVELFSMRGAEMPRIHAHHPAELKIEVPDLPDAVYRVDLVDAEGRLIWSGQVAAAEKQLRVREPKALKAGLYWVRLYSPGGELLREFGLESFETGSQR